jgi:hypothetical protein
MNITYYKARIKKIKKWQRQGKYPKKKMESWIIGCRNKIKELKNKKNKRIKIKNAKK